MGDIQKILDEEVGTKWRKAITVVAVLIAVYTIGGLILGLWPFSSAAGVVQKVTSAEAIIGNYQWFYDQYNAIQAQKANLATLDKSARERPGLLMVLNTMIGEYNSRSKQITRNLWKASDLPYSIPLGGIK